MVSIYSRRTQLASKSGDQLTKDLVSDVVFSDKISKKLFVDTSLINHLVREISIYIQLIVRLLEHTAVSQKVQPNSMALSRTGSASSRLRLDPRPKLMPMAPKPGDGTVMSPKGIVLTIMNEIEGD
jgi:hypothetical protein